MKRVCILAGILLVVIIASGTAQAATLTWENTAGGDFGTGANWVGGVAPVAGDSTIFTSNATYTVTFATAPPILNSAFLTDQAGVITLDITGQTLTYNLAGQAFTLAQSFNTTATVYQAGGVLAVTNAANNSQFVVGQQGSGNYFLTNGTLIAQRIILGNASTFTSQGKLVIDGSSSVMIASNGIATNPFVVGSGTQSSSSQLIVTNGGRLFSAIMPYNIGNGADRNNNKIIVTGAGSALDAGNQLMRVGSVTASGNSLLVNNSGLVTNLSRILIADGGGSNNSVSVTDGGKIFVTSVSGIQVGQGTGNRGNSLVVGGSGASALVSSSGSIVVGANGGNFDTLTITNGTLLTGANGLAVGNNIGNAGGNSNRVDVFAGGTWNVGNAQITVGGASGTGTIVRINSGGFISNVSTMIVVGSATALGNALELNGGSLSASFVSIRTNASLRGSGTISGNTTVDAGGLITPGFSIGELNVDGNLTLAGTFKAELDGTGSGSADKVNVLGTLDVTGATLQLSELVTADDPAYIIAQYGTLVGTFATVNGLPTGASIDYNYNGLNEIAVVVPEPSTIALVGAGLILMGTLGRRRRAV